MGPKPNTNVSNVDVPKWLWRGGVRPNWDNVLKSGFFFILKASLTENHHGIGQNFMLPVRLPVIGLHGKKMPSFISDQMRRANDFINMCGHIHLVIFNTTCI